MRKITILMICLVLSLLLVSCSKSNIDNNASTIVANDIYSEECVDNTKSSNKNNTPEETENSKNNNPSIKSLYVSCSGINIPARIDENGIKELLKAEKNSTISNIELKTELAKVIAIYDDETEKEFGTICIGSDDSYYLKFANNGTNSKVFKLADNSMLENLL